MSTSATSGKKIDCMRKEFSIDQVRYMPFWLEDSKKLDFNSSSNIPFIDIEAKLSLQKRQKSFQKQCVKSTFTDDNWRLK